MVLEKTLESPLDCREIQPLHSEGDQPWDFFGRNDAKAETPVLRPLMRRVDSLEKTGMLGGIGGSRRRGQQRTRWLDGITDSVDRSMSELRKLAGTLIPSAQRLVWAAKQALGNAALGALFA